MTIQELQIGDWVKVKGSQSTAMSYKVDVLNNFSYYAAICCGNYDFKQDMIEPIPLTAEILKANGFVTNKDHTLTGSCIYHKLCGKYEEYKVTVRLLNGWLKIESFDDRWRTLLDISIQPRYVHELQHALRLCGYNELADNFKLE